MTTINARAAVYDCGTEGAMTESEVKTLNDDLNTVIHILPSEPPPIRAPEAVFHFILAHITNPPAARGARKRLKNEQERLGRPLLPHEVVAILDKWLKE